MGTTNSLLSGNVAPALAQLFASMQARGAQAGGAPALVNQQQGLPPLPAAQQKSSGPDAIGQSIEGMIGGLMGGSGASGGQNSLNQGLAFQAAPTGAVGPFAASSPLSALGAGASAGGAGTSATGSMSLSKLAPLLMSFL